MIRDAFVERLLAAAVLIPAAYLAGLACIAWRDARAHATWGAKPSHGAPSTPPARPLEVDAEPEERLA